MKLGFPRAMNYYDYYPFWAGFFHYLGVELKTSRPTNQGIMENGLKKAYTEMCLPIKLLVGHINELDDVDGVFLPRMVSMEEKTYLCPKILGLPEGVQSAIPSRLKIYTVTLNYREGRKQVQTALENFGRELGYGRKEVRSAYKQAQEWQGIYEKQRLKGWSFEACMRSLGSLPEMSEGILAENPQNENKRQEKPHIALIGHPYLIYEGYVNHNLLKRLEEQAYIYVSENVEKAEQQSCLQQLRKPLFWSHAQKIYGAGSSYVKDQAIEGIIYLTCFGCGSDSMTEELVASQARKVHKPYMVITLDEHTGEAGLVTRLEAFLDMIARRQTRENNLSSYGKCLDCDSNLI